MLSTSQTVTDLSAEAVYILVPSGDQCKSKTAFLCPLKTCTLLQLLNTSHKNIDLSAPALANKFPSGENFNVYTSA